MPKRRTDRSKPESREQSAAGHSPLGGSSADRYIHCSGSVYLKEVFGVEEDESEYAAEGTAAHAAGAACLISGGDAWEEVPDVEQSRAVQSYLDYARVRGGVGLVELDLRAPAFHPQAFGRLDLAIFDPQQAQSYPNQVGLEIIDYKHGVGVQVSAQGNAQLRAYAQWFIDGETWPADRPRLARSDLVRLTIVQPRGYHPDGPIRSEVITVGELSEWAYNVLRPAMQKAGEQQYAMGEWCHFCPSKLMCPEMRALAGDAGIAVAEAQDEGAKSGDLPTLAKFDDAWLDAWYGRLELLDWFKKAIRDEVGQRARARPDNFKNAKLVYAIPKTRLWKPEAEAAALAVYGQDIYSKPELLSPAQIEKLPGGPDFTAEWAFLPPTELVVVSISDRRTAQKLKTDEEVFKGVLPLTADDF